VGKKGEGGTASRREGAEGLGVELWVGGREGEEEED